MLVERSCSELTERRQPGAHQEPSERAALITHIAVFVLVNGILWAQDILAGGGLDYAYMVTIPWGLGLIAHITAYVVSSRDTDTPARHVQLPDHDRGRARTTRGEQRPHRPPRKAGAQV